MGGEDDVIAPARRNGRAAMAKISPLPPPEEVFADWLVALPPGACIEAAARRQIALIDRAGLCHPDLQRLRVLLAGVAGAVHWQKPAISP